jgi:phage terminase large subunit-like protein
VLGGTNKRVKEEILRCAKDFPYFARNYLKIVDINGADCSLELNRAQKLIIRSLETNNNLMILKARKLGSTTVVAGYFLWKALFKKNTSIAVVAHTDEAARAIFGIYKHFYKNLPNEMRITATKSRHNELALKSGSLIKVGTAQSESFRGQTYQYIHASEYAFWPSLEKTIMGLFGTADANATNILE